MTVAFRPRLLTIENHASSSPLAPRAGSIVLDWPAMGSHAVGRMGGHGHHLLAKRDVRCGFNEDL